MRRPDLCADRIDYSLRDRVTMNSDSSRVSDYIKNFVVKDKEIIFANQNSAKNYAQDYLEMDYKYWSHPKEVALFQILANAIKIALDSNVISQDDLFEDDDFVYNKLKKSKNSKIQEELVKLNPKLEIMLDKKDYDFFSRNKLRYVDPKFIDTDGKIKRVSDISAEFKSQMKEHKNWIEGGNYIKIINF